MTAIVHESGNTTIYSGEFQPKDFVADKGEHRISFPAYALIPKSIHMISQPKQVSLIVEYSIGEKLRRSPAVDKDGIKIYIGKYTDKILRVDFSFEGNNNLPTRLKDVMQLIKDLALTLPASGVKHSYKMLNIVLGGISDHLQRQAGMKAVETQPQ